MPRGGALLAFLLAAPAFGTQGTAAAAGECTRCCCKQAEYDDWTCNVDEAACNKHWGGCVEDKSRWPNPSCTKHADTSAAAVETAQAAIAVTQSTATANGECTTCCCKQVPGLDPDDDWTCSVNEATCNQRYGGCVEDKSRWPNPSCTKHPDAAVVPELVAPAFGAQGTAAAAGECTTCCCKQAEYDDWTCNVDEAACNKHWGGCVEDKSRWPNPSCTKHADTATATEETAKAAIAVTQSTAAADGECTTCCCKQVPGLEPGVDDDWTCSVDEATCNRRYGGCVEDKSAWPNLGCTKHPDSIAV